MNAQEQQMLQGLIDRVRNSHPADKDPDAEQLLQSSLGADPDALYVLAQTVLVQGYALSQAQQQLQQLRAQNQQLQQQAAAPKHTSFLGSLLGHDEPQRPAPPPPPPMPAPSSSAPAYRPLPNYPGVAPGSGSGFGAGVAPGSMPYAQPGYPSPAGGGGFFRSALQTATGVAAGALAFQGIEDLMHGFGHGGGGFGGGFMPTGDAAAPHEEVINNYYGDAGPNAGSDHSDSLLSDPNQGGGQGGSGDDIWNSGQNASQDSGQDASQDAGQDDLTSADPGVTDDSGSFGNDPGTDSSGSFGDDSGGGFDDSGSGFDDSGSFDDSGGGGGF